MNELQNLIQVDPACAPGRSEGGRRRVVVLRCVAELLHCRNARHPGSGTPPQRQWRSPASGVWRTPAGTVSGRPVAELSPLPARPAAILWDQFVNGSQLWRADPGLARELAELIPGTTDDIPIP